MKKWPVRRALPRIPPYVNKNEWCIVQYYNTDGSISTLVRLKYQWDAQRLNQPWKYVAVGLTEKQAMEFNKLF
jgi:hypothetical protein